MVKSSFNFRKENQQKARVAIDHQKQVEKKENENSSSPPISYNLYQKFVRLSWQKKLLLLSLSAATGVAFYYLLRNSEMLTSLPDALPAGRGRSAKKTKEILPPSVKARQRTATEETEFQKALASFSFFNSRNTDPKPLTQLSQSENNLKDVLDEIIDIKLPVKINSLEQEVGPLLKEALHKAIRSASFELQKRFIAILQSPTFLGFNITSRLQNAVAAANSFEGYGRGITLDISRKEAWPNQVNVLAMNLRHELVHLLYGAIDDLKLSPFDEVNLGSETPTEYLMHQVGGKLHPSAPEVAQIIAGFKKEPYYPGVHTARLTFSLKDFKKIRQATTHIPKRFKSPYSDEEWFITKVEPVRISQENAEVIMIYTLSDPHLNHSSEPRKMMRALFEDIKNNINSERSMISPDDANAEAFVSFVEITGFEIARILCPELISIFEQQVLPVETQELAFNEGGSGLSQAEREEAVRNSQVMRSR